jgi:hypothetical protein
MHRDKFNLFLPYILLVAVKQRLLLYVKPHGNRTMRNNLCIEIISLVLNLVVCILLRVLDQVQGYWIKY